MVVILFSIKKEEKRVGVKPNIYIHPHITMMSSSSQIKWNCPNCQVTVKDRDKYCNNCQTMLVWTCIGSEKNGLYKNYRLVEKF